MKYIIFFLLFSFSLVAQESVNVYHKQEGPNVLIYADNNEVIPMTVELNLDLVGMKSTISDNKGLIVVPGNSKKFLLTKTSPNGKSREMSFGMNSSIYFGDITLSANLKHQYSLPIEKKKEVQVYQGYNGKFSHKGEQALDFGLEVGDKVFAARGGIVYKVIQSNSKSCGDASCSKYNNLILIYHEEDGTSAEYVHLDKDGANVKVGDRVNAGQLIGLSGNTGWTSGPHLHFMVYQTNKKGERKSVKTLFQSDNDTGIYLKEKELYQRKL